MRMGSMRKWPILNRDRAWQHFGDIGIYDSFCFFAQQEHLSLYVLTWFGAYFFSFFSINHICGALEARMASSTLKCRPSASTHTNPVCYTTAQPASPRATGLFLRLWSAMRMVLELILRISYPKACELFPIICQIMMGKRSEGEDGQHTGWLAS